MVSIPPVFASCSFAPCKVTVKVLESKETVTTTFGSLRFVNSAAQWWDYSDRLHYDPAVGLQAGIAQAGLPASASFGDWNANVNPLLVGALNLSAVGDGSAIIGSVTVEFFPQHVPVGSPPRPSRLTLSALISSRFPAA